MLQLLYKQVKVLNENIRLIICPLKNPPTSFLRAEFDINFIVFHLQFPSAQMFTLYFRR
jgi:hypothetical protein